MTDKSYIGKGQVYMDGRAIGNVSELSFSIEEEKKELQDFTSAGGGLYNSLRRISSVELSMTMHDYNADNLAVAMFGTASAVAAGAVSDEAQTTPSDVSTDVLVTTDNVIDTGETVTVTGYVEDTDFTVNAGGIVVLASGSIPADTALAISYTKKAVDVIQTLTTSAQEYVLDFVGLNEAQSGDPVVIKVHRAKFGGGQDVSIIGDDFGSIQLTGDSLKDTSITTSGLSQYAEIKAA